MSPAITLQIGGSLYQGWKSAEITLGVDQFAGSFALDVVQGLSEGRSLIVAGDRCSVSIGEDVLISGYVDEVGINHDAREVRTRVEGRDVTGDLVDCSAQPRQWRGRTLTQIARDLVQPFGIEVIAEADVGAVFASFAAQPGETVMEALERMARHRGVLLVSNARGGILIKQPGTTLCTTELVLGRNLLSASVQRSQRERYSRYTALAQAPFSDDAAAITSAQARASSSDDGVLRHRPLIVLGEDEGSVTALKQRAEWERSVRAGRSVEIIAVVQGWRHAGGIWRIDQRATMVNALLGINGEFYIAGARYLLDPIGGTTTELRLLPPSAYTLLAMPEGKR